MTSHTTLNRTGRAAKSLAMALALAAVATAAATPTFAATHHHRHRPAQSARRPQGNGSGAFAQVEPFLDTSIDPVRGAAIRDCTAKAQPYSNSTWQTEQFAAYGACMTEHGQMP